MEENRRNQAQQVSNRVASSLHLCRARITLLAMACTLLGACHGSEPIVEPLAQPVVDGYEAAAAGEEPAPVEEKPTLKAGRSIGKFEMTYYWLAEQKRKGLQEIVNQDCRRIARATKSFKRKLRMEGSGKLMDGRTVSVASSCKCDDACYWLPGDTHPWGAGVRERPLSPFRSIAVDTSVIKIGTTLYIRQLDGLLMPGEGEQAAFVHDGCVVADDRGGNVVGNQVDLFTARVMHYQDLATRHRFRKVEVFRGGERCSATSLQGMG